LDFEGFDSHQDGNEPVPVQSGGSGKKVRVFPQGGGVCSDTFRSVESRDSKPAFERKLPKEPANAIATTGEDAFGVLSLAGAWSIYELLSTSTAVEDLLIENYESINSGKMMLEALEREDSAVLLGLLGRPGEERQILASADSLFQAGFTMAAGNVTIPGENTYVDRIEEMYVAYKVTWGGIGANLTEAGDLTWYFESPHRAFLAVKASVHDLIDLNADTMYNTASRLKRGADRAVMPGIVAIVAALVFSVMFSYFVNLSMVKPIVRITDGIGRYMKNQERFDVRLEGNDELSELADSIGALVSKVRVADRESSSKA